MFKLVWYDKFMKNLMECVVKSGFIKCRWKCRYNYNYEELYVFCDFVLNDQACKHVFWMMDVI